MNEEITLDTKQTDALTDALLESPNIWQPPSIDTEPTIELRQWSVMELNNGDRHFVGLHYEGRVSSKIMTYDKETSVGVTRSGRRYLLIGNPGKNADADYVWQYWKVINKVAEYRDVSSEYIVTTD